MSNLGQYQWITTVAKKVGGPIALLGLTAVGGWVVGRGGEAGGKGVANAVRRFKEKNSSQSSTIYEVTAEADCGGGLTLRVGNQFKVLKRIDDVVQIEVLDDENNPYFASAELLMKVSDFRD